MPKLPFGQERSPPRSAALETTSEKQLPRRTSLSSKANQRLQAIFSTSPKLKGTDAQALEAATAAQQAYLTNKQTTLNSPSLSLPTICLSTATGEKSKNDDRPLTLFQPPSPSEAKKLARQHAQFGPLGSQEHKYSSRSTGGPLPDPIEDEPPYFYVLTTYMSYLMLIIFGHVRDFFGRRFAAERYKHLKEQEGYAPLNSDFDNFYVRRLKTRINDCFSRPVTGVPGRFINLIDRKSDDHNRTFQFTGTTTETLNMSSYNYLGFAQSEGPCADDAEKAVRKYGTSFASPRADAGTSELALEVERLIADFVGKESSMIFSMGFGTNATVFPAIVGKGCLVISDELNHSSIRFGMRLSGAVVQTFKHNDMKHLERLLREVISQGQPKTHRPWKRILVVVEGLYSMEGTLCNLPELVRLKRKYKYHLFVDEAHSIGAIGPRGRGICDYFGVDPSEISLLMGTLTKSFGANGGYLAGDKAIIDKLRVSNAGCTFGETPSAAVLQQISTSVRLINGEVIAGQGEERLQRLAFNSRYLRLGLKRLGFIVAGHDDSPIIPLMVYHPAKISAFSHEMLKRKISVVVVGYPATPLVSSRARFCVSAAHTKDDLDRMLEACNEIGEVLQLKYSSGIAGGQLPCAETETNSQAIIKSRKRMTKSMMVASGVEVSDSESVSDEAAVVRRRQAFEQSRPDANVTRKQMNAGSRAVANKPPRWKLQDVLAHGVADVKVPLT